MRGVPKGYREIYNYKGRWDERKVGPREWKGRFTATKHRNVRGRGGPQPGSTYWWKISGVQRATKLSSGRYQTVYDFRKRLIKSKVR